MQDRTAAHKQMEVPRSNHPNDEKHHYSAFCHLQSIAILFPCLSGRPLSKLRQKTRSWLKQDTIEEWSRHSLSDRWLLPRSRANGMGSEPEAVNRWHACSRSASWQIRRSQKQSTVGMHVRDLTAGKFGRLGCEHPYFGGASLLGQTMPSN